METAALLLRSALSTLKVDDEIFFLGDLNTSYGTNFLVSFLLCLCFWFYALRVNRQPPKPNPVHVPVNADGAESNAVGRVLFYGGKASGGGVGNVTE